MTDIRIRIGNRTLTRAQYLRERDTPAHIEADIRAEQHAHKPCHAHILGPKWAPIHPHGPTFTAIIKSGRNYMATIRKELLTCLLKNRHEFHTAGEFVTLLNKSGIKCHRSHVDFELTYIRHALEPQNLFGVTTKPDPRGKQAMAYKFTGTIERESDIPGLVDSFVQEVTKAASVVRSMKLEARQVHSVATRAGYGKTAQAQSEQEQTVHVKLLLDVQVTFSVKVRED